MQNETFLKKNSIHKEIVYLIIFIKKRNVE